MIANEALLSLASKRFLKRRLGFLLPELAYIDFPDAQIRIYLSLKDMKGPSYHLLHRERRFMDYEEQNRTKTLEILKSLSPNPVYFDIGSNIGLFSTLVAKEFPAGKVFAFDPDPVCYMALTETKIYNVLENLHIIPVGLSEKTALSEFYFDPLNHGGHSFDETNIQSGGKPIRSSLWSFRLDEIVDGLNAPRIDMMKVDVQGFEWQVLRGAERTIAKHRPTLMVECEHKYAATATADIEKLFPGYVCENAQIKGRFPITELPRMAAKSLSEGQTFSDYWFFPQN